MNSSARSIACAWLAAGALLAARATAQTIERVSVSTTGAQASGPSYHSSISSNGRFVAFDSSAPDLVPGDTNSDVDVFVRDRASGTTERVSVATGGGQSNYLSTYPVISADGRYVVFGSLASNLVPGDTNGVDDVFLRDRQFNTTERVSLGVNGAQGDQFTHFPSISADGHFVAFFSLSTHLVVGDTNNAGDYFVRDRWSGSLERVSVNSSGVEGDDHSSGIPWISGNGRFVAFHSLATNFAPNDTNGCQDVFVRDRLAATTERISESTTGAQGDYNSAYPSITPDGRFVAFVSQASTLVAGDTNIRRDIFVRDRSTGVTERVSVDSAGVEGNSNSDGPAISASGRWVVFFSEATNLVPGDTNGRLDVFLRDRTMATTSRISTDAAGVQGNGNSYVDAISDDGRFVLIASDASNLVAGDTNGQTDLFLYDRGAQTPYSYCTASTSTNGCSATIAANTNPSATFAAPCSVTVVGVEGLKSGLIFYGIDNTAFSPLPWAPGSTSVRCVKYPVQRTPLQNSGGTYGACNGSYALDWDAYQYAHPLALGNPWSIGATLYVQAWYRDPPAPKSTNLSNAIELTYTP